MNSQEKMGTWEIIERKQNMRVLKSKWVYVIKNMEENKKKFKARLVATGFSQKKGVDYNETYSPVIKLSSLRTILAIANKMDLELRQMDVKTAYLNGEIDEAWNCQKVTKQIAQEKNMYAD